MKDKYNLEIDYGGNDIDELKINISNTTGYSVDKINLYRIISGNLSLDSVDINEKIKDNDKFYVYFSDELDLLDSSEEINIEDIKLPNVMASLQEINEEIIKNNQPNQNTNTNFTPLSSSPGQYKASKLNLDEGIISPINSPSIFNTKDEGSYVFI